MAKTLEVLAQEAQALHQEVTNHPTPEGLHEVLNRYNAILNHAPDESGILFLIATTCHQIGYNGLAINLFNKLSQEHPELTQVWTNLGSAYKAEHMDDKARDAWLEGLKHHELTELYNNLTTLHINVGDPKPGIEYAEKALDIDPDNVKAHWNMSLCLLEDGQWKRGFQEYESGLLSNDRINRVYSSNPNDIPYWTGQDLKGKTIVCFGEQGLGDEIMFLCALQDLIDTGAKVIYDSHDRLEGVVRRSFPSVTVYPTRKGNEIKWPKDHKIDYRVAVGSLFYRFYSEKDFKKKVYLKPDPKKVKVIKERLQMAGSGPYIGVGYEAGAKKTHGHCRSFKLSQLKPILEQEATFISLQYTDDAQRKFEQFEQDTGIKIHHFHDLVCSHNNGEKSKGMDYDWTLALLHCLDLCILPNTTAVHASGAIGSECWTLTPQKCAWRYAKGGPWMRFYGPWVRQYHESKEGWEPTIKLIVHDLIKKKEAA